jgi:hypothetical protein
VHEGKIQDHTFVIQVGDDSCDVGVWVFFLSLTEKALVAKVCEDVFWEGMWGLAVRWS